MPRSSSITPELVAEVRKRRATGEPWKAIARNLRQRGLPSGRTTLFRALSGVPEHLRRGQHAPESRSK